MSHHRITTLTLSEAIAGAAKTFLSDNVVRQLVDQNVEDVRLGLFADRSIPDLTELKNEAERIVRDASPEEFRSGEIRIRMKPRERIGRCVSGAGISSRRFNLVDVHVTIWHRDALGPSTARTQVRAAVGDRLNRQLTRR